MLPPVSRPACCRQGLGSRTTASLFCVALWLLGLGLLRGQEFRILDEIVAKVNQEVITLTDLKSELRKLRRSLRQSIRDPQQLEEEFQKSKKGLLKILIQNKLLVQKAEELGLSANIEVDVAAALENSRKQLGAPNMKVFEQYLKQQGSSMQEYRQLLRENIIIQSVIQQFVYSKITLLTPEIKAYYKEHIDRFTEPATVHLRQILFMTEGKRPDQVRRLAQEVLAKLRQGADFQELAREYSEGPTAGKGGDIGTFKKGTMADAIEKIAFTLEEGQVSDIIETDQDLQIIQVVKRTAAHKKKLEEVRTQISNELYQQKARPELKAFLEELQEQSYIYIADKYRKEYDVSGL